MFARPELLLAFSISGVLIVIALVLLAISARRTKQLRALQERRSSRSKARPRTTTLRMFSGATVAALEQVTRQNPARQRQVRIYS